MTWHCFRLTYQLRSPLHIGYHKVGNLQRTRYYIPARNLWGAVTEALTRRGFSTNGVTEGNYQEIGAWVKEHCAFGYWFIQENGKWLYPCYDGNCLKYGNLTVTEFERRYLDAHVTTALDPTTTSAEEGSLHEVEFIAPYHPVKPSKTEQAKPTRIGGWVFLDDNAMSLLGEESKWRRWLGDLQIGGERRYGFGQMHLFKWDEQFKQEGYKGYTVHLNGNRPQVEVKEKYPLLAHTTTDGVKGKGMIEPFVGRETDNKNSNFFGCKLTNGIICWMPGMMLESSCVLEILQNGVWKANYSLATF